MGADLSKLRGGEAVQRRSNEPSTTGVATDAPDPSAVKSGGPSDHPDPETFTEQVVNDVETVQEASATKADDSLAYHREQVQRLRGEQTSTDKGDELLRSELKEAGLLDQRDAAESSDASSDDDSDSDDSDDSGEDVDPNVTQTLDVDEGGAGDNEPPATKNEVLETEIPTPSISQVGPEEMPLLQHIGHIHSIVDSVVLVAQTPDPREIQGLPVEPKPFDVLDSESLLCTSDGRVIGLVYETFGSVQKPMYSIRFPSVDAIDRSLIQPGVPVYFLPTSSTYVLTRAIRTKGSDASNIWDEEVGEDEAEYSDDEEEAAAKRRAKQERRARTDEANAGAVPSNEMDPLEASLGPLGGYPSGEGPSTRGSKRKDKARRGRGGASFGDFTGGAPRKRGRPHAYGQPAAPHINPRFAGQWLQPGPMPYGMPMGMPMPPFPPSPFGMPPFGGNAHGAYSPNHAQMDAPSGATYDPRAPHLNPRPPSGSDSPYTPH